MASVSSLDRDMRNIRLSKYTPQAAKEVRAWIEDVLGEQLTAGDLLDALKDGVALCKLINLAAPPGVRFKQSSMPFVQMENISHFLRACQSPPLNLQSHDVFQTVDLYESKDPAQVLQCIAAFSRRAHSVQPSRITNTIGEKSRTGVVTPQSTGGYGAPGPAFGRTRGASNTSETSSTVSHQASQAIAGRGTPTRLSETSPSSSANGGLPKGSGGVVSSWSKKTDEGATIPAWNIHQYGYMGGATQGNQGITFGGRRQITTPAPKVPSFTEKQRKKREEEAETERLRQQAEEAENERRIEREAEEERERLAEEQRWEEEVRKRTELERLRIEEEKRRWEQEERKWKEEEEARVKQDREAEEARVKAERETEVKSAEERSRKRASSDARLKGQFLGQYQTDQGRAPPAERSPQRDRVKELERQLEEAKEREAQYERERREKVLAFHSKEMGRFSSPQLSRLDQSSSKNREAPISQQSNGDATDEREFLRNEWTNNQTQDISKTPAQPSRPLPTPQKSTPTPFQEDPPSPTSFPQPPISSIPPRPLPNPATYTTARTSTSPQRKSPFARPSSPAAPPQTSPTKLGEPKPTSTFPLKKPPFANPSSLLSREMELDRQRQQEWEESQRATKEAAAAGVSTAVPGPGDGAWDVHQYGYLGGDSQNRGGTGIGFGAGRRQLVGPRDPRGKS